MIVLVFRKEQDNSLGTSFNWHSPKPAFNIPIKGGGYVSECRVDKIDIAKGISNCSCFLSSDEEIKFLPGVGEGILTLIDYMYRNKHEYVYCINAEIEIDPYLPF